MQFSQLEARGRCVSLIEDDPVMGGSLAQRLKLEGYEVDWRRDGREAVTRVSAQPPGAVICDILASRTFPVRRYSMRSALECPEPRSFSSQGMARSTKRYGW